MIVRVIGRVEMIIGNNIILRAYEKEDESTKIQKMINNPEVLFNLRPDLPMPFSYTDQVKFIDGQSSFNKDFNFAIANKNNEYMGGCGLMNISWVASIATVGIWLGVEHLNKGYGTEALDLLVKYAFEQLNIRKVKLTVFGFNKRGIRCYEKVGFKVEAVLKDEIYRHNQYWDKIIMTFFKEDYEK